MAPGHDHGRGAARRSLVVVLLLTMAVVALQAAVGLVTGSLALLADAGHALGDAFGLALAWVALTVAARERSPGSRRSFGNHRTEVIAAGVNGLILLGVAGWVVVGAVRRLEQPPNLDAWPVLAAAIAGLAVNVVGLLVLRSGATHSLNLRGAYLEVLGDALGSVAVIVSAALVLAAGWDRADPIASLVIAAMIVPRAVALLREVLEVLLESTPAGTDLADLRRHLVETEGVADVHDLHVWTITSGMPVMTAHVVVDESVRDLDDTHAVLDRLRACVADHFDVDHSTFQLEPPGHRDSEPHAHG